MHRFERLRLDSNVGPEAADSHRGAPGAARFAELRRDLPRDSAVVGLTVKSDMTAVATIQGHEKGRVIEYIVSLILEAGAWKVGN